MVIKRQRTEDSSVFRYSLCMCVISLEQSRPVSVQLALPLHCTFRVLSPLFPIHNGYVSGFVPLGLFDSLEESQNRHLQRWQGITCLCRLNTLCTEVIFTLADQTAWRMEGVLWTESRSKLWFIRHCVKMRNTKISVDVSMEVLWFMLHK